MNEIFKKVKNKIWIGVFIIVLLLLGAIYFLGNNRGMPEIQIDNLCEKTGGVLVDCSKARFVGCGTNSFIIDGKEYGCVCPKGAAWDPTRGCVNAGFNIATNPEPELKVSTDKTQYMIGESIIATIKNNLETDIWIPPFCTIPFKWLKQSGEEWNEFYPQYEIECSPTPPTKISAGEETKYTARTTGLSIQNGEYKFLFQYSLQEEMIGAKEILLPLTYSNEFSIRACSTNSECSFFNTQRQAPRLYGLCLDGTCVQSCNPEEYVVGCE